MARRVGVVLAGCGGRDGTDVYEAVLALLAIERSGAVAVCAAPDAAQARVVDHASGEGSVQPVGRRILSEAARLAPAAVRDLARLDVEELDALIVPGGDGVTTALSNYAERGAVCDVNPDLARLCKACLKTRRPMGFIGMSAVIAARVLGPLVGVRVTLGPRATIAAKHAAVMGAEVRPAGARDVLVDPRARLSTTPGSLAAPVRLADVATGVERLVRGVLATAQDRGAAASEPEAARAAAPAPPPRPAPTPGPGSGESGRAPSGTRPPRSRSLPRGS